MCHAFLIIRLIGLSFLFRLIDHVFYLATNKHLKYETQGEVVSLA